MRWIPLSAGLAPGLLCGLLGGLAACGSSSAPYNPVQGGSTGTGIAATTSGGTTGGGSTGGEAATGGTGGGSSGQAQLGVSLHGDLAFSPLFAGEFYGLLPDGGPDLSNLDCRISDGTDLGALCSPALPLDGDAGAITSRQVLDIYVTSLSADALTKGIAAVSADYAGADQDGGEFATIELTLCTDAGDWNFERASLGQVSYQASPSGMFGSFQAVFPGYADGGGVLDGTFGAGYCGPLSGY